MFRRLKARLFVILFCSVFVFTGITLVKSGNDALEECSGEVTAAVVDRHSETVLVRTDEGSRNETEYHVTIEYVVDGDTYSTELLVNRSQYDNDVIDIRYNPDSPASCMLEADSASLKLLGYVFIVVGVVFMFVFLRGIKKGTVTFNGRRV